ncbi:hypothetical protein O9G_001440 [Rozella allomycis CSF55]|uniref:Uncharacterized protein n=1 Tax=Rozella allomycis (strain CSF55) TaxID=988480 RepID=A0A075B365_ROZAC|nr:hypothetical protein O9G_001440 [Rozella allomycis CSF55]|eukprot:EPZ36995.1 hypothetical protein O9G_001440 [Rozella allomycis CSF55]
MSLYETNQDSSFDDKEYCKTLPMAKYRADEYYYRGEYRKCLLECENIKGKKEIVDLRLRCFMKLEECENIKLVANELTRDAGSLLLLFQAFHKIKDYKNERRTCYQGWKYIGSLLQQVQLYNEAIHCLKNSQRILVESKAVETTEIESPFHKKITKDFEDINRRLEELQLTKEAIGGSPELAILYNEWMDKMNKNKMKD